MLHPSLPLPFQSVIGLSRYLGASNFFIVTSAAMYIVQPCYIIIFICYRYRLYSCTQPVLSLGILYSIKINFVNCCGLKFIGILYESSTESSSSPRMSLWYWLNKGHSVLFICDSLWVTEMFSALPAYCPDSTCNGRISDLS